MGTQVKGFKNFFMRGDVIVIAIGLVVASRSGSSDGATDAYPQSAESYPEPGEEVTTLSAPAVTELATGHALSPGVGRRGTQGL